MNKPWGNEKLLASFGSPTVVKIMSIAEGKRNSLHYHNKKTEYVYCLSGVGMIQRDTELIKLVPKTAIVIDPHITHRITAISDLEVLEIGYGEYDGEDIVRMEDDYERVKT